MFAYIKGKYEDKGIDHIVIDVGGIGYKIYMPYTSIEKIGDIGKEVKVHTHYYVREDNISIYGFLEKEELRVFELLLLVSGVGCKLALNIISGISPYDFSLAVISSDLKALTSISGVGPKVAQRIVLELKDRLKTETALQGENVKKNDSTVLSNNNVQEAISALQVLGYSVKDIKSVIDKIENVETLNTEDVIKQGLKYLGR